MSNEGNYLSFETAFALILRRGLRVVLDDRPGAYGCSGVLLNPRTGRRGLENLSGPDLPLRRKLGYWLMYSGSIYAMYWDPAERPAFARCWQLVRQYVQFHPGSTERDLQEIIRTLTADDDIAIQDIHVSITCAAQTFFGKLVRRRLDEGHGYFLSEFEAELASLDNYTGVLREEHDVRNPADGLPGARSLALAAPREVIR